MKYPNVTLGRVEAVWNKMGGEDAVDRFLRGELTINEVLTKPVPVPVPEPAVDSIIRVDRSIRPSYPDWVKTVMHPELENVGPAEYNISVVEQWLHEGQKDGKLMEGNKIYAHLKEKGDLKNHFGLRDLEEIQKKGIVFFRKNFKGRVVFGWAGIVRDRRGYLDVPCLYERGGEVVLGWLWAGIAWHGGDLALRFASSTQT